MRATAGTDVVIDVLVFRRRAEDQPPSAGPQWMDLAEIELQSDADEAEPDNSGTLSESYPLSTGTEASDHVTARGKLGHTVGGEIGNVKVVHPIECHSSD